MNPEKYAEVESEFREASNCSLRNFSRAWSLEFLFIDVFLFLQLKADSEEATKKFEHIVRVMNEELARFQEQKTADIGLAFHEFAKGQAKLAKDIADAWRSVLPKLEACSSS